MALKAQLRWLLNYATRLRHKDLVSLTTDVQITEPERTALARAIDLASTSRHINKGNPQVAAVIIDTNGQVISEGVHAGAGSDHAEFVAIIKAGRQARGATLCVSFEPCDHQGHTPPCATAIIDSGITRVVFGACDRTKQTSGAKALQDAGIAVLSPRQDDPLSLNAESVVYRWQFAQLNARPWVTWKLAASIDGYLADPIDPSAWFSSNESCQDVHDLRELVDAVIIGTGTALIDDPALTARSPNETLRATQPIPVIVGDQELPSSNRVLTQHPNSPMVLPRQEPKSVLDELFNKGINHVLLEAGPKLSAAFVDAGLIDELIWFITPKWFGTSGKSSKFCPTKSLKLVPISVTERGGDLRLHASLAQSLRSKAA